MTCGCSHAFSVDLHSPGESPCADDTQKDPVDGHRGYLPWCAVDVRLSTFNGVDTNNWDECRYAPTFRSITALDATGKSALNHRARNTLSYRPFFFYSTLEWRSKCCVACIFVILAYEHLTDDTGGQYGQSSGVSCNMFKKSFHSL